MGREIRMLVLLLLLLFPLVSAGNLDTVVKYSSFPAYEGHQKARLLVASVEVLPDSCNWAGAVAYAEAGLSFDDTLCEGATRVEIGFDPEYIGFIPKDVGDLVNRIPLSHPAGCSIDDSKGSCNFPYTFTTWVSDNDYANIERWNKYLSDDLLSWNDGSGIFDLSTVSGRLLSSYVVNKYDLSYDLAFDTLDMMYLTALDSGYSKGKFGGSVCNSRVGIANNNEVTYFSNPSLNDETQCDSFPDISVAGVGRSEFAVEYSKGSFYNARINYYEFPFIIGSVGMVCFYDGGEERSVSIPANAFYPKLPSLRYNEFSTDSDYYSKEITGHTSASSDATQLRTFATCPGVDFSGVSQKPNKIIVEYGLLMNPNYRHLSPFDHTARWSDLFSSAVTPGGYNNQFAFDIVVEWNNINITDTNESNNYIGNNITSTSSITLVPDTGSKVQDTGGSFIDDTGGYGEFSDSLGNMLSIARSEALIEGEENFFDSLLSIAIILLGVFLIVYTIFTVVLFVSFIFLFMFGIIRGSLNAIDEMFDVIEKM